MYRIRYNVYCQEFKYEPAECFPHREESDDFDQQSLHCLITHKPSRTPAGCVRLVSPTSQRNELPFEKYCSDSLDQAFIGQLELDRHTVCEVSRLAVDGAFRRRAGEGAPRYRDMAGLGYTKQERRAVALLSVACVLSATATTALTTRTNVFAMMEPSLPKLLQRFGLYFQRAGRDMDYHGWRAPYFISCEWVLESMRADLRELYEAIFDKLKQDFPVDYRHFPKFI
ncbi:PEP-CTERM/exosortase system-associated acyltransferase [Candidatus Entotheonella palauensis]|uniref:PEP-CTERM/exosortase system-associated acyltransferase n=1 Tax=Candidatus Entotheonella palauensis TaxID=93172 RepID=UPI000B7D688B|nr:PEP-CTERM/exosortase system-associated acyltransferase [Candidatus Entotheonella palauensis]